MIFHWKWFTEESGNDLVYNDYDGLTLAYIFYALLALAIPLKILTKPNHYHLQVMALLSNQGLLVLYQTKVPW